MHHVNWVMLVGVWFIRVDEKEVFVYGMRTQYLKYILISIKMTCNQLVGTALAGIVTAM